MLSLNPSSIERIFFSALADGAKTHAWNGHKNQQSVKKYLKRKKKKKLKAVVQMGISTKKDGGRPYLRMLSVNTRTAQKCIQELKTFRKQKSKINKSEGSQHL